MPRQYLYVQQSNFLIHKMNFTVEAVPARLVVRVCSALANEKVLFVQIDVILVLLAVMKLLHAGS